MLATLSRRFGATLLRRVAARLEADAAARTRARTRTCARARARARLGFGQRAEIDARGAWLGFGSG